jgi:hypothetical protein
MVPKVFATTSLMQATGVDQLHGRNSRGVKGVATPPPEFEVGVNANVLQPPRIVFTPNVEDLRQSGLLFWCATC